MRACPHVSFSRILILIALWPAGRCAAQALSLSAVSDAQTIPAGRTVSITITATWEGTDGAQYILSNASFPGLRNLEMAGSQSAGSAVPGAKGMRFERKLTYTFQAKEPGEAETGTIEVKYYRPQAKGEKVASADEKKEPTKPLVQTLPSMPIKVTSRDSSAFVPILILVCAGVVVLFFAYRMLRAA